MTTDRPAPLRAALAGVLRVAGVTGAKIRALVHGYHTRRIDSGYRPDQVDKVLRSPVWNPATGRRPRKLRIPGATNGGLRLCPHICDTPDHLDRAIRGVKALRHLLA